MADEKQRRIEMYEDANGFQYFAYGSNMLRERIQLNNPTARVFGIGKLYGYTLTYDMPIGRPPSQWYGASATIRAAGPDHSVYGVIWNMKFEDMAYLDSQEMFYNPFQVVVELDSGETVSCRSYEMFGEMTGNHLPSPHYKRVIIAGAKQNGLPEEYIQYLESFPDNRLSIVPPNYQRVLDLVAVRRLRKEKTAQMTTLDYSIEHELLALCST